MTSVLLAVLTSVVALVAWLRFPWAVALLILGIPFFLWRVTFGGIPTNVFEVLTLVVVIVGMVQPAVWRRWQEALQTIPAGLVIGVVGLLVASVSSASISAVPIVSWGIIKGWIVVPLLVGWLVYAVSSTSQRDRVRLITALIVSGTVTAAVSLPYMVWGQRLAGIYDVPNSLALWLTPLIVLAAAHTLSKRSEYQLFGFEMMAMAIAFIVMLLALVLTLSLAGIVVTILMLSLVAWSYYHGQLQAEAAIKRRIVRTILVVAVGLMVLIIVVLTSGDRIDYFTAPLLAGRLPGSVAVRQQLWSVSVDLIRAQPITGIGLGQFEPQYQRLLHDRFAVFEECSSARATNLPQGIAPIANCRQPLSEFVFRDPHNWLLSFWLNTGLVGLLSFIGINMYVFRWVLGASAFRVNGWLLLSPLMALLLIGLVDTIYWKNDLATLYWVLLALTVSANKTEPFAIPALRPIQHVQGRPEEFKGRQA